MTPSMLNLLITSMLAVLSLFTEFAKLRSRWLALFPNNLLSTWSTLLAAMLSLLSEFAFYVACPNCHK